MDNQERSLEELIEHVDAARRIIRRRNEQIENQARNAEEDQRVIDEQDARINSLAADLGAAVNRADRAERERDEYRAMHSEQMKTIARLQQNHRPEGAEELEALIDRASLDGEDADNESLADYLAARLIDPTVKES